MRIASYKLVIVFLVALHLVPMNTQAQQSNDPREITGRVMDAEGVLLDGVTVEEIGTANGTTTDENGTYSLTVSE